MDDRATLSELAAAELDALRADGITVTDDDVVHVNALAWAVETPESRRLLSRGVPVEVGGCVLWPLTLAGADWYDRVGCALPGNLSFYALGYAQAYGRSDGPELDCEGREAERRVKAWRKALRCTKAELDTAMTQLMDQERGPDMPEVPTGKPVTPGDFSAHLAAACGGTPDFWERRCSFGYAVAVLTAIAAQNQADGRPNANDPRIMAECALGLAIERIRERHNGEA